MVKLPFGFRMLTLLRYSWVNLERRLLQALGFYNFAPALSVQAPAILSQTSLRGAEENEPPCFLDSIFWMAAPKKRRTIEVNRCRRRNPNKLEKIKSNIQVCPECGHLKLKHVLCGFCYQKVRLETGKIRQQMRAQEGGPFNSPTVETVILYEGEAANPADKDKRIVEIKRKRPSWFTLY
ncbi:39S ribosomal protein L32, mitochondrial [Latimeria chalumnae]|uniref:Large ribosomal subunit protein bL32m n=1 Tax=Latimeria chalumnae TaxID=7897 RepID=H3B0R1_LATCH|nr:PREDICTED: 39S ribosomal protein L32, mitochondrial [Latimeria chalumnae]|eukprot:XP_006002183.1 PREDICTED: 39S ribosomal protein L32, mitochondrial [Latimeria chalumnae]